jgi:hypothetical protein
LAKEHSGDNIQVSYSQGTNVGRPTPENKDFARKIRALKRGKIGSTTGFGNGTWDFTETCGCLFRQKEALFLIGISAWEISDILFFLKNVGKPGEHLTLRDEIISMSPGKGLSKPGMVRHVTCL